LCGGVRKKVIERGWGGASDRVAHGPVPRNANQADRRDTEPHNSEAKDNAMTERVHTFTNDGFSFEVSDSGLLDGELVVLLHGFPQTSRSWDAVRAQLHERGHRTLAFDQRGYAPGARPRGRFAYRSSALVGDVVALIKAAGEGPVHVVGHDWGSAVAWGLAARFPELVRTLTSVSVPHPRAFLRSMLSSGQIWRSYYMLLFQLPWLPELLFRVYAKRARAQARQVPIDIADANAVSNGLNWYRAMPFTHPSYLRRVSVPTTHVWSTSDIALSRRGAELCERYVTGPYRLEVLEGTHWIPEERPEQLSEIIVARISGAGRSINDSAA
jgi:pimeloyl-ACP methyl ester carboxylesterase